MCTSSLTQPLVDGHRGSRAQGGGAGKDLRHESGGAPVAAAVRVVDLLGEVPLATDEAGVHNLDALAGPDDPVGLSRRVSQWVNGHATP